MINNKKKKNIKIVVGLFILFVCLLGLTIYTSFSTMLQEDEIIIKSMTPVYDETSGVVVEDSSVIFNDKNQVVKYKVVLENTQDCDVKISDINLSTPTEEFLDYKVEGVSKDEVVSANSTKELTVSFETMRIDGWGRNFADELTANISFEKQAKQEEATTPEEDKEEEKQPEAPAANTEELTSKTEKIEVTYITEKDIEITGVIAVSDGDQLETWIYPDATYIGTHEIEVSGDAKKIIGIIETLKKEEVKAGEYNIALVSQDNETLGYISVYVSEEKQVLKEKVQNSTDKEESNSDGNVENKPSTGSNNKDENIEDDGKIENPYTSDKGLIIILGIATCVTGVAIIIVSKNRFAKYTVLILMLGPAFTITKAEEVMELSIKNNVSFESQNVMKSSGCKYNYADSELYDCEDYWAYNKQIEYVFIYNDIAEAQSSQMLSSSSYIFDVTEEQNGRVMAYLVDTLEGYNRFYLFLVADGIIYFNEDASYYFADMKHLYKISNLSGVDTGNVTNMRGMFQNMSYLNYYGGEDGSVLDLSRFDTSNVTDMSNMFYNAGYCRSDFTIDLSNFDTSKVTNMNNMLKYAGYNSNNFNTSITIKNPNVTSYTGVFSEVALNEGTAITVKYTQKTEELVDEMLKTRSDACLKYESVYDSLYDDWKDVCVESAPANVIKGNAVIESESFIDIDKLSVGDEIHISGEKFNVISQTDDTITMLAQYNLGANYKQSTTENYVSFSESSGWEYTPGPKEIDIQKWSTNPKIYVNAYAEYLKATLSDNTVSGDLITLTELKSLGCTISDDYSMTWYEICENSPYKSWIVNAQFWGTRSASSTNADGVFFVTSTGLFDYDLYKFSVGVRPVITISKDALYNYLKTS